MEKEVKSMMAQIDREGFSAHCKFGGVKECKDFISNWERERLDQFSRELNTRTKSVSMWYIYCMRKAIAERKTVAPELFSRALPDHATRFFFHKMI